MLEKPLAYRVLSWDRPGMTAVFMHCAGMEWGELGIAFLGFQ